MKYFYSKQTNGFYLDEVHGENMSSDVVEISEQQWNDLLTAQSNGKVVSSDSNGSPVAVDRPIDTVANLKNAAMAALVKSDSVALRCYKAGQSFPQAWIGYVSALRGIINSSNPTTSLPTQPAYPPNT